MRENDKTSIVFLFLEIERSKQFCNSQTSLQLDSTCMFGAMFSKILVIVRLFPQQSDCKNEILKGKRAFISRADRAERAERAPF